MTIFLLSLIVIYFGTLLGATLFSYAIFWYEACNSDHRDYLRRISGNRVGRWLIMGAIGNLISQNLLMLFFPLCLRRRLWDPEPDPTCANPPVLLLHGMFHNAGAWVFYRWILRRRGFRNTYAVSYSCRKTNFTQLLERLDETVHGLLAAFPDRRIILVGHSLGGLLAKAYAEDSRNHEKIFAVVTLGTPYQGSKLAAFGINRLVRSLIYKGELVQELRRKSDPSSVPKLAIYSPIDNLVLPNDSLRVAEPGWSALESFPSSHIAMLYDKRLAELVADHLLTVVRNR